MILLQKTKYLCQLQKIVKVMIKHSSTGKLFVEPISSMVTEPVSIWGANFKPNIPVTIHASVNCPSENLSFSSQAYLLSDNNGYFNLRETESYGGSYAGTYGMGLFWSMVKNEDSYGRFQMTNASTSLTYVFKIFEGHVLEPETAVSIDTVAVTRFFAKENVTRIPVKSGNIRGTMFVPEGDGPFPAIITMYGGNKEGAVVEDAAGILSNYGFVTLALAFYGVDDLPKSYALQPVRIEYFEEAIEFLSNHNKVNKDLIGIFGSCKGGDIGLAMISHLSQIKALAWVNACIASVGSNTTYKDKSTDMLSHDLDRAELFPDQTLNIINVLTDPRDEPKSIHRFETSEADILMIAGIDDCNWRSEIYVDIAKEQMDHIGKTNYEIVKYPGVGHLIDAPYMPPCVIHSHAFAPKGVMVYYGGIDKIQNSTNQEKIWKKVIAFFNASLR